jgi:hypothetical protein
VPEGRTLAFWLLWDCIVQEAKDMKGKNKCIFMAFEPAYSAAGLSLLRR